MCTIVNAEREGDN